MRRNRRRDKRGLAYSTRLRKSCQSICYRPSDGRWTEGVRSNRWTIDVCGDVESLELATTARERLKGLLFTDPDDVTRLLIPCHDVHTFGMRYPLDIAFISREGKVLDVHRNVSTMRRLRNRKASLVAERFSRDGEWLKEGDVVHIGTAER